MEAYTEAANTCIARLFAEAKRAYQLWPKEIELIRLRKEIEALKLVIPLLVEPAATSQIEHVFGSSYVSIPCGQSFLSVPTAELPSAPFAARGAATNQSAKPAMIAT
jgi:hypothetical protein